MTNRYTVHFHGSYLLYAVSLFLACLMVLQSNRVREMQVELRELRQWTSLVCGDIKESSTDISRCGVDIHNGMEFEERGRFQDMGDGDSGALVSPFRRTHTHTHNLLNHLKFPCHPAGSSAFLHLVPLSSHSYDEDDYTLVEWALGLSRLGEGLQVFGEKVNVVTEGTYFIYSQVLYKDTTWTMGHVIKKRLHGIETILMKCIQSMPSNITVAQNTCYTAGVHYLEPGSTLELSIPRKSAGLVLKPHSTFLGMFRI
ncbi:tumor necrosis factor ligand superfamily member 13 isoform X1 [Oncorhynchus masou masou]|uniref:tumor necrosis factor ligand superfamily member 13 isoform X1 n=1 Tax=Oncorhynchus masou masou TaxID=90313 RepID=UPI00318397CB